MTSARPEPVGVPGSVSLGSVRLEAGFLPDRVTSHSLCLLRKGRGRVSRGAPEESTSGRGCRLRSGAGSGFQVPNGRCVAVGRTSWVRMYRWALTLYSTSGCSIHNTLLHYFITESPTQYRTTCTTTSPNFYSGRPEDHINHFGRPAAPYPRYSRVVVGAEYWWTGVRCVLCLVDRAGCPTREQRGGRRVLSTRLPSRGEW